MTTDPTRPLPVRLALVGVAAALVLGIVGLHLLQVHGSHAHAAEDQVAAGHPAVDHEHEAVTATDLVVLCVAMLAGSAGYVLLLARLRRSRRAWAVPRGGVLARAIGRAPSARAGPPPEWAFSVVRC